MTSCSLVLQLPCCTTQVDVQREMLPYVVPLMVGNVIFPRMLQPSCEHLVQSVPKVCVYRPGGLRWIWREIILEHV